MDIDEILALHEQFDKGVPVPAVEMAELKQIWTASRLTEAMYGPPEPNKATGLAALGVNTDSHSAAEVIALCIRHWLLVVLAKRGVLKHYQNGDVLDERALRAAATVPFKQPDLYESIMSLELIGKPEEIVSKVKKDFRDHGYDLDHPAIEAKFLAWMRDSC